MKKEIFTLVGLLALLGSSSVEAVHSKSSTSQPYLLLATSKTSTLKDELAAALGSGYRVLTAWTESGGGEKFVMLEGFDQAVSQEVQLLAALQLPTLERELSEAASRGFRLVPEGVLLNTSERGSDGEEVVLLTERVSDSRYQYVSATASGSYDYVPDVDKLTGTLSPKPVQEQLERLVQDGYALVSLVSRSTDVKVGRPKGRIRRVQTILLGERESSTGTPPHAPLPQANRYRALVGAGLALQHALNRTAAEGYRLFLTAVPPPPAPTRRRREMGEPPPVGPSFPEVLLVVERVDEDVADDIYASFSYLVITSESATVLKHQMKAAAKRGYRLHPRGVFSHPLSVIMERRSRQAVRRDYAVLETSRTSSLEKEVLETAAKGYSVIGAGESQAGHNIAILEKNLDTPALEEFPGDSMYTPVISRLPTSGETLTLATRKTSTMQSELDEATKQGFRIQSVSTSGRGSILGDELSVRLEKLPEGPAIYDYSLLATTRVSTLEKEMNETAARGFRMLPGIVLLKQGGWGSLELIVLMEKKPDSDSNYEYLIVSTNRESTLEKELLEAINEGYEIVGSTRTGEHVVLLERPKTK